jgi:hypothetical protein
MLYILVSWAVMVSGGGGGSYCLSFDESNVLFSHCILLCCDYLLTYRRLVIPSISTRPCMKNVELKDHFLGILNINMSITVSQHSPMI